MKKLKIIAYTFDKGGAARAAADFSNAGKQLDYDVECVTTHLNRKGGHSLLTRGKWYCWLCFSLFSRVVIKIIHRQNIVKKSLNLFSNPIVLSEIKSNGAECIYHFHWIANDTLSIKKLREVPKGSIFTLHDEWLYSGTEHYNTSAISTWSSSFEKKIALKIDDYVLGIKKDSLSHRSDLIYTVPSSWMLEQFKKSDIPISTEQIFYLPNSIDTKVFKVLPKNLRQNYNIKSDSFVICFGADNSNRNLIKGTDLLYDILAELDLYAAQNNVNKIEIVIFGGLELYTDKYPSLIIHTCDKVSNRHKLAELYNISDLFLCLSRREAFGLCVGEAMACGTPVIGFSDTGITDMVIDNETGFLVEKQSSEAMYNKLIEIINLNKSELIKLSSNASSHINDNFSEASLKSNYSAILNKVKN